VRRQAEGELLLVPVMVDELRPWPGRAAPGATRTFGDGKESCHLTLSPGEDMSVLHAFAERIGLRRSWFQPHASAPHYDLTPSRRAAAIVAGAAFVPAREQARARVKARRESMGKISE